MSVSPNCYFFGVSPKLASNCFGVAGPTARRQEKPITRRDQRILQG
jgi:hypothetical protein